MSLLSGGSLAASAALALAATAAMAAGCSSPSGSLDPGGAQPPGSGAAGTDSARPAGPTIVSLTFDDGIASAFKAKSYLAERGLHATFFVNSGHIGQPSFMTWEQVEELARAGNEIGGHTALHVNLPLLEKAEAQRQICNDRVVLLDRGHEVTSFAYPFGATDRSIQELAQACGYNSARTTTHVERTVETVPPGAPYAIQIGNDGTPALDEIKAAIGNAIAGGGGWMPILFHGICDGCSEMAISETSFVALLDWLEEQQALDVTVQTVGEVIGGTVLPAVDGPAAREPPNGTNAVRNASLEADEDGDGEPDCWRTSTPSADAAAWAPATIAHGGSAALTVEVAAKVEGAPRLSIHEDLGQCTPSVVAGHRYRITAWYMSTVPTWFTTHTRERTTFVYGTKSPDFPPASDWALAEWVTPPLPDGVDGLSFGISIGEEGSLTVDDLGFDDAAAAE